MSLSQNATDALIISGAVALVLVLLVAYYCYRRRANRAALNQHLLDEQNGGSVNNNGIVDKNATSIVGYDGASPLPRKGVVDSSHYRVKKALGDGAYGSVYLAVRRTDHTNVAVKVIPCRSEQEAKESMNEFHIAQSVQDHPNVVKVFDVFVDSPVDENGGGNGAAATAGQQQKGGSPKHAGSSGSSMLQALRVRAPAAAQYLCIVSEYCQEGTLFDLLITVRTANNAGRKMGNAASTTTTATNNNNNGATTTSPQPAAAAATNSTTTQALPPNRRTTTTASVAGLAEDIVWAYTEQLLEALSFLHSRNLMHRDLKPSNVLLTDNHRKILLTDFGLSRVVEEKEYAKPAQGRCST